jgi:hypothetical protein
MSFRPWYARLSVSDRGRGMARGGAGTGKSL